MDDVFDGSAHVMEILDVKKFETFFYISKLEPEGTVYSIHAEQLIEPEHMISLITQYAVMLKALDHHAAAAFFTSWFSRVVLALQYTMSIHNTTLNFSLSNITVCLVQREDNCGILFRLHDWSTTDAPNNQQERSHWRHNVLARFYSETVRPLFK